MSKFVLTVLFVFPIAFFHQNSSRAQTTTAPKLPQIVFALYADGASENTKKDVTEQIEKKLASEGYTATFVKDANIPTPYAMAFGIDSLTTATVNLEVGDTYVQAIPYTTPISKISPILEKSYLKGSRFIFKATNDKNEIAKGVNLATALALYAVGACDRMNYYLDPIVNASKDVDTFDDRSLVKSLYFYKGNCSILKGDYRLAADQLGESFIYDGAESLDYGKLVGSVVNYAWAEIQIGKQQEAIDLMTIMVNDIESFGQGYAAMVMWINRYIQRAEIYNLVGHYDDAVNDLTSVIEMTNGGFIIKSHAYLMRGQTYILLYKWDNVLADYNKALELDPTYADAYFYRGVLKYSVLQTGASLYNDALNDFQQYLELAPDGEHAADASRYATDIQTQLNALNN